MSRTPRRFDIGCTIEVEHTHDHLHAHVALDGDTTLGPGDKVRVHGSAVRVPFGAVLRERRRATVTRARWHERLWTKIAAHFDLTELYEVSFTPGRLS